MRCLGVCQTLDLVSHICGAMRVRAVGNGGLPALGVAKVAGCCVLVQLS